MPKTSEGSKINLGMATNEDAIQFIERRKGTIKFMNVLGLKSGK